MALFLAAYERLNITCDDADTIEEAWHSCTYSHKDVSRATGISVKLCKRTFEIAKAMDIIYPDGVISVTAKQYISRLIAKKLRASS